MSLEALRTKLDALDDELIALLARRADVVAEIWRWKSANGVARIDPTREAALRERLLTVADGLGLDRAAVSAVLDRVIAQPFR